MEIRLICTQAHRADIHAILNLGGVKVREEAELVFVEKGMEDTEDCDAIIRFTVASLPGLIESLKNFARPDEPVKMLVGKRNDSFCPVGVEDIVFAYAVDNDVFIHDRSQNEYLIRPKLYQLEAMLLPDYFIRINKSEIVNIRYIQRIDPMFKGRLIIYMEGEKRPLDISRSYTKGFKERLGIL